MANLTVNKTAATPAQTVTRWDPFSSFREFLRWDPFREIARWCRWIVSTRSMHPSR